MANTVSKIKVELPKANMSFEEELAFLLREFGVGRADSSEDVPSDEDCAGVFELEIEREEGKA